MHKSRQRQDRLDSVDAARSLFDYLNIADILRLAVNEGALQLDDHVIKDMKKMRDAAESGTAMIVPRLGLRF